MAINGGGLEYGVWFSDEDVNTTSYSVPNDLEPNTQYEITLTARREFGENSSEIITSRIISIITGSE